MLLPETQEGSEATLYLPKIYRIVLKNLLLGNTKWSNNSPDDHNTKWAEHIITHLFQDEHIKNEVTVHHSSSAVHIFKYKIHIQVC